ncbi:MAG: ribosome biogenesis GTP-binding protein YihA/YsxC [Ignavibacteriaceae bacterium]|nr:ribosome biogenesis GTP-binding protein YihA/YsxC [Ignavibacteriaceae bacterium]
MLEQSEFIKSVYDLKELPARKLPEVILCGRSNVGKSSFINSLLGRQGLAKISSTPGKTRCINYYLIDNKFYLVDLPGYGYAKTSQKERLFWGKLVSEFISSSENIVLAIHLIDCRHKPTDLDIQLNLLLIQSRVPFDVILSKSDKLKQSEYKPSRESTFNNLAGLVSPEDIIFYSSIKGKGKKEVQKKFWELFYSK